MSKELLAVPEENLSEVIRVIRAGLAQEDVSEETRLRLTEWCDEEEEYISGQ